MWVQSWPWYPLLCMTIGTSLRFSGLFLHLCHGVFLAVRASEPNTCAGAHGRERNEGTESRR